LSSASAEWFGWELNETNADRRTSRVDFLILCCEGNCYVI
jgi:hypothetical protein